MLLLNVQVTNLTLGQRVASPFTANCGSCFYCSAGVTCRCQHAQARLFGWIDEQEAQASAPQLRAYRHVQLHHINGLAKRFSPFKNTSGEYDALTRWPQSQLQREIS